MLGAGVYSVVTGILGKLNLHFSPTEQSFYIDGTLEIGDFAGLTKYGEATKIEVDYELPAVPSTGNMFSNSLVITKLASCLITETKVIVLYRRSTPDLFIVAGDVDSDGVVSWGAPQDTGVDSTDNQVAICAVSATDIVYAWNDNATDLKIQGATVAGDNTFTFGAASNVATKNVVKVNLTSPDPSKAIIFYGELDAKVYSRCLSVASTPPVITLDAEIEITETAESSRGGIDISKIGDNKVVYTYISYESGTLAVSFKAATVSGTVLTLGNKVAAKHSLTNSENLQLSSYETDKAVGVYCDGVAGIYGYYLEISGTTITLVSKQLTVDASDVYMLWPGNGLAHCFLVREGMLVAGTIKHDLRFVQRGLWSFDFVDALDSTDIAFYSGKDKYCFLYRTETDHFGRARAFQSTIIGQTGWGETVPVPTVKFLGICGGIIQDAEAVDVALIIGKGVRTGIITELDPRIVYVKGPNELQSVITAVRGTPHNPMVAVSHAVDVIEIFPEKDVAGIAPRGFVSNTQVSLVTGNAALNTWSPWVEVADKFAEDVLVASATVSMPDVTMTSFIQIAYGVSEQELNVIVEFPVMVELGFSHTFVVPFPELPAILTDNIIYARVLNNVVDKDLSIHVRLVR